MEWPTFASNQTPMQNQGAALQGIGGIGALAGGLLGNLGYKNPAGAAQPYFNQIPGTLQQYYNPYIDSGKQSLASLMSQYNQLTSNPGQKFSELGQGFQQSPGYQFQYNQGMNAANSAAAAGGMLGTSNHQMNSANMASNLANQDYYNYMNQIQNLYGMGLGGLGNVNQMGFNASTGLADNLAANLMNQGNMAYAGQNNANQAKSSSLSNLFGGATSLLSSFF